MILKEAILKERSKKQRDLIVRWIGKDPGRFTELISLFLQGDYRVTQRAAWPLSTCAMAHPQLIQAQLPALVAHLHQKDLPNAVKRNVVRLLQTVEIPPELEGSVLTLCMDYLASDLEPVAVKAFSLKVLERLSQKYPEILPEIRYMILAQLQRQSPAFRVRARVFLKD